MKKIIPILLLVVVVLILYWRLPGSFFEQDEWHTFSFYNYLLSLSSHDFWRNVFSGGSVTHFTPLSLLFKFNIYRHWGLTTAPYFMASMAGHIFNSLAVYFLIYRLSKNRFASFLGALFFVVNSSHHQAVTWIGTFEGTQWSLFFGIISFIFLTYYFEKRSFRFFVVSLTSFVIGLLFKETIIFFIPLFVFYFYSNKIKNFPKKEVILAVFVFVVYGLLRLTDFSSGTSVVGMSSAINVSKDSFVHTIIYNFLTAPVKVFAQDLLPNDLLISLSRSFANNHPDFSFHFAKPWQFLEIIAYDLLTFTLGLSVLLASIWVYIKSKKSKYFALAIMGIILSTIPALLVRKFYTHLDSRFLYPTTFMFAIAISFWYMSTKKRLLFAVIFSFLIIGHTFFLLKTINDAVYLGELRKNILGFVVDNYPTLGKNTVIYTDSNLKYWNLPVEILPFQSGVGNMLLVTYSQRQKIPVSFYKDFFLWEITEEGYRKIDDFGFGYYYDFEKMKSDYSNHYFTASDVIAFRWDGEKFAIKDVSDEIRLKLEEK